MDSDILYFFTAKKNQCHLPLGHVPKPDIAYSCVQWSDIGEQNL